MGWFKKLAAGLLILAILLVIFAAWHLRKDAPVTTDEIYRDDEIAQTKRAVDNFIRIIDETKSTHAAPRRTRQRTRLCKGLLRGGKAIRPEISTRGFRTSRRSPQSLDSIFERIIQCGAKRRSQQGHARHGDKDYRCHAR